MGRGKGFTMRNFIVCTLHLIYAGWLNLEYWDCQKTRPSWRPRRRWEDNIRTDLIEIDINTRIWVDSVQDRDYWWIQDKTLRILSISHGIIFGGCSWTLQARGQGRLVSCAYDTICIQEISWYVPCYMLTLEIKWRWNNNIVIWNVKESIRPHGLNTSQEHNDIRL